MNQVGAQKRAAANWVVPAAVLLGWLALAFLPQYVGYFAVLLTTEILIFALFSTSFNLIFGYGGLLSFGNAAFFGVGAYTAAIMLRDAQVDFLMILPAAMLVAAVSALIIGALSVKLNEVYFAMLTLAFGMMVHAIAFQWRSFTNGSDGITGFRLSDFAWLDLNLANPVTFYYLTLGVVSVGLLLLFLITRSPFGLVLRAIRENRERVAYTGSSVYRNRLLAFVISGALAGLAGALYGPFLRIAAPSMLHWSTSAEPIIMSVLGGSSTFLGPGVGAAVYLLLQNAVTSYTDRWMLYLGIVLVLIVLFFPRGLLGSAQAWVRRARR